MSRTPPYTNERNGRLFFELGKAKAKRVGMRSSVPLGLTSKAALASAWKLYAEWLDKSGQPPVEGVEVDQARHPKGSLGHFFDAYRRTPHWKKKAVATRTEWDYCWNTIGPKFGARQIDKITPGEIERWQVEIEEKHGAHFRWKHMRVLRALFSAAVNRHIIDRTPARALPNPQPAPRAHIWRAGEVDRLVRRAAYLRKHGLALGIRLGWETMMSPGDLITLTPPQLRMGAHGAWFEAERAKTGAAVFATISDALASDLRAYIAERGIGPDEPILRNGRDGNPYNRVRFSNDFAKVRRDEFGEGEKRQFRDLRRSANLEAALGDAAPSDRAAVLANALDKDAKLELTYTPHTVERARKVEKARVAGRALLEKSLNSAYAGVLESE